MKNWQYHWPFYKFFQTGRKIFRQPKIYLLTPENKKDFVWPAWFWKLIFVLAIILVIAYFFLFSPLFKIRQIKIEGEVTREGGSEIEKFRGKNIFLLRGGSPEIIKKDQPGIKAIKILRGLPDTLRVEMIERKPLFIWQANGEAFLIDDEGIAFLRPSLPAEKIASLPKVFDLKNLVVIAGQKVAPPQFGKFILEVKELLFAKTELNVVRFEIEEITFQVQAVLDNDWKIKFDTMRPATLQIDNLKKLLDAHRGEITEYIDLRVEGQGIYK